MNTYKTDFRYKFEIKGLINKEIFEIKLIDDIMLKIR